MMRQRLRWFQVPVFCCVRRVEKTYLRICPTVRGRRPTSTAWNGRGKMLPMTVEIARIPPKLQATVGGPRRSCARLGCLIVFVGSQGTRYCSAECQESREPGRAGASARGRSR